MDARSAHEGGRPDAKVLATYPRDVYAWQGVSQNGQIREFLDEGILMAENAVPPGPVGAQIPFLGQDALDLMKRYNEMAMTGVLVEDSHSGTVTRSFGAPMARLLAPSCSWTSTSPRPPQAATPRT